VLPLPLLLVVLLEALHCSREVL
jgi:hypothetical protein